LAQQNISKSARKKIKVLQPLESAAHGEDIMGEGAKLHNNKVLSRHKIHNPKAKLAAKKRKRNRHLNHLSKIKEHEGVTEDTEDTVSLRHVVKQTHEANEDQEMNEVSGSGAQVEDEEEDNADVFPLKEEFWSR